MKKRFEQKSAVYLILQQKDKILLMQRAGSGYMDGFYSVPAGHVEENETLKQAAIREAKEEINIDIIPEQLDLVLTLHRNSEAGEYIDLFFKVKQYQNTIKINEPEKCTDLVFSVPSQHLLVPYVKQALQAIADGKNYLESDW